MAGRCDTDRLNFLLGYFRVEDVGDAETALGVGVRHERLCEDLGNAESWGEDLRDIIDRAILRGKRDA